MVWWHIFRARTTRKYQWCAKWHVKKSIAEYSSTTMKTFFRQSGPSHHSHDKGIAAGNCCAARLDSTRLNFCTIHIMRPTNAVEYAKPVISIAVILFSVFTFYSYKEIWGFNACSLRVAISIDKQKGGGLNGKSPPVTVMPENLTVPIHIKSLSSMLKICINHVNYSKMLCWERTRRKKNDGRCLQMKAVRAEGCRRQVRVAKAALGSDRPNLSPNINKHIFSFFLLRMHASLFSPFHAVCMSLPWWTG